MLKKILFEHCANHLNNNLLSFEKRRLELLEALESESKNSAGDKHETGRAMLQLEREKLGEQIKKTERNLQLLMPLQNHIPTRKVSVGAVVKTSHFNYYIAISSPTIIIEREEYYCISTLSPIGKLLLGKKVGETLLFNQMTSTIKGIF